MRLVSALVFTALSAALPLVALASTIRSRFPSRSRRFRFELACEKWGRRLCAPSLRPPNLLPAASGARRRSELK
jgi:hypothetical protein